MKNIHVLQILSEILPFIRTEDAHRQADQCPQMNRLPGMIAHVGQIMNLGMAIVTRGDAVIRTGLEDLFGLEFAIIPARFWVTGLQEPAAAAAAVVVRPVGAHVDKIFFTDHRLDHIPQVLRHRVTERFTDQLAGVLDREFDLTVFVPFGTDFQLAFFDPLGIVLNDALDFEIEIEVELLRSGPDREQFVPSLGVEPDLAAQVLHRFLLDLHDVLPVFVIGHEHAVVFRRPTLGAVSPVGAH